MSGFFTPEEEAADDAKYQALKAEMVEADGLEPEPLPAEQPEPQPEQQYQPQHQEPPQQVEEIPHVYEDPVTHFDARAGRLEQHAAALHNHVQQQQLYAHVERDEKAAEQEFSDYWDAVSHLEATRVREIAEQFPSNKANDLVAQSRGYRNAAALRDAQLAWERSQVVLTAAQRGASPARLYYQLAQSHAGYRPRAVPKSVMSRTLQALKSGTPEESEKAWAAFEKAIRAADENYWR